MTKRKKQITGQVTLAVTMSTDRNNYVVQANDLVGGKQALKLNSAKLIRAAIMQIKPEDEILNPYLITIPDLAELLDVPKDNLYRDIDDITDNIICNPVFIKTENGDRWVKYSWITYCEYQKNVGVIIQLNDMLKPFLVALKQHYTQYTLDSVLSMKSIYAIRIFELLQAKNMQKVIPKNGMDIELTVQEIRDSCNLENKYSEFSNFKIRVLDAAVKEINRVTLYDVSFDYMKTAKKVTSIVFHINMKYH